MTKKPVKNAALRLPVQELNWSKVPDNTQKLYLQFDCTVSAKGSMKFGLVAYPAFKNGKTWEIGEKITLVKKKGAKRKKLSLPVTLGNLELNCRDLEKCMLNKNSILTFTPKAFTKNPHASYLVTDDLSQEQAFANPSPPARPLEL